MNIHHVLESLTFKVTQGDENAYLPSASYHGKDANGALSGGT